jgi:hypothetical protein
MKEEKELFELYRPFYIYLVAHRVIHLDHYVKNRNVGELYCLIADSLSNKKSLEIAKSVEIVLKMLKLNPDISPDNRFALNGMHVLLIDGLEKAK